MSTESTANPAQQIAAGYAVEGQALELGAVVIDGKTNPTAQIRIPLATVNRHGLVAGATGTGKTKTLQVIAEQLSAAGVPVLMADVKGDLSGLSRPGESSDKITGSRQGIRRQLGAKRVSGGLPVAGNQGHRCSGACHDRQLRADPAVKGVGAQRYSRVNAGLDLPLCRAAELRAAGPERPACGDREAHQRRRQGRFEVVGRRLRANGRRHPARPGQSGSRRRRYLFR